MIAVEITDELERRLRLTAEASGLSPEQYAKQLLELALAPPQPDEGGGKCAAELLTDYVGAFDSGKVVSDPRYRSAYGDVLDEKFSRQGIVFR